MVKINFMLYMYFLQFKEKDLCSDSTQYLHFTKEKIGTNAEKLFT